METRRYALPAICSIGLHTALIFGFNTPAALLIATVASPHQPPAIDITKAAEEVLPPLPSDETGEETSMKVTPKLGTPRPSQIDLPRDPGPGSITIEVSPPGPVSITKVNRIGIEGLENGSLTGTGLIGKPERILDSRQLDRAPTVRFQPGPDYPSEARRLGLSGTVLVDFVVGKTGEVIEVHTVHSDHSHFDEPARKAVARWRFEPGRREGRIVAFRMRQLISFTINPE